jgi:Tfp pilus assembly protein PilF
MRRYYSGKRLLYPEKVRTYPDVAAGNAWHARGGRPFIRFVLAFAGNYAGAIREAEALKARKDAEYPALLALRHFYKSSHSHSDTAGSAVRAVEDVLEGAKERALPPALVLAGQFLWVNGDFNGAHACADQVLKENPDHDAGNVLKGWCEAHEGLTTTLHGIGPLVTPGNAAYTYPRSTCTSGMTVSQLISSAQQRFEAVIARNNNTASNPAPAGGAASASPTSLFLEASMGLSVCYERKGNYSSAIDILTDALSVHNWFLPAACEQSRLFAKQGDWDQCHENITRVLEVDATSIECHRLLCLIALLREGPDSLRSATRLQELHSALSKQEPKTARLGYDLSRLLSRFCARSRSLLSVTISILDSLACKNDPENAHYQTELAYQRLLAGDIDAAANGFREASRLDETSGDALTGLISCHLLQGQYEEAESQLELVRMIMPSSSGSGTDGDDGSGGTSDGKTAVAALIDAQLAWRKNRDRKAQLGYVGEAFKLWAKGLSALSSPSKAAALGVKAAKADGPQLPGLAAPTLVGNNGAAIRILSQSLPSASLLNQMDGLPLPTLLPGNDSDVFEFYYRAQPDLLFDLAREVLLSSSASVAPSSSASKADDGSGTSSSNVAQLLTRMLSSSLHNDVSGNLGTVATTIPPSMPSSTSATATAKSSPAFLQGELFATAPGASISTAAVFSTPSSSSSTGPSSKKSGSSSALTATPAHAGLALLATLMNLAPAYTASYLMGGVVLSLCGATGGGGSDVASAGGATMGSALASAASGGSTAATTVWDGAVACCNKALNLSPGLVDAHLLLAHVGLSRGDVKQASDALEGALSQSFSVSTHPGYLRIKAAVLFGQWLAATSSTAAGGSAATASGAASASTIKAEEALRLCEEAFKVIPKASASRSAAAAAAKSTSSSFTSVQDRALLHLLYIDILMALGRLPEAQKAVSDALQELRGAPGGAGIEEGKVMLSAAKLALKKGDPDAALQQLNTLTASSGVPPPGSGANASSFYQLYTQAMALKAEILLVHRRDRRLYIQCYQEAVAASASLTKREQEQALIALGDAFMRIQLPEDSVASYEKALALRPSNTPLACKVGRALTLQHDYGKAVTYFTSALAAADAAEADAAAAASAEGEDPATEPSSSSSHVRLSATDRSMLRSELTELLLKLRRFDEAKSLITQAILEAAQVAAGGGASATITGSDHDIDSLIDRLTAAESSSSAASMKGGGKNSSAVAAATAASARNNVSLIISLRFVRRNLQLLAKVLRGQGGKNAARGALTALEQSYAVQGKILSLARKDPNAAGAATAAMTNAINGASSSASSSSSLLASLSGGSGGTSGAAAGSDAASSSSSSSSAASSFGQALVLSLTHSSLAAATSSSSGGASSAGASSLAASLSSSSSGSSSSAGSASLALHPSRLLTSSSLSPLDLERLESAALCLAIGSFCESSELSPPRDDLARAYYGEASEHSLGLDVRDVILRPTTTSTTAASSASTPAAGSSAAATPAAGSSTSPTQAAAQAGGGNESLPPSPHETAMLAMARLHLRRGEFEECRAVCDALLSAATATGAGGKAGASVAAATSGGGVEQAHALLADLLFYQGDTSAALYHYAQLLERRPNSYQALARVLNLLRRSGRLLQDSPKFFRNILKIRPHAEATDLGYKYCKGLILRYSNEVHEAIRVFNSIRVANNSGRALDSASEGAGGASIFSGQGNNQPTSWGVLATEQMVSIYLSPDNDPLWAERDKDTLEDPAAMAAINESLKVAQRLLETSIPSATSPYWSPYHEVLTAYILAGSRTKDSLEQAQQRLLALLGEPGAQDPATLGVAFVSPDFPPALMALATIQHLSKQGTKSKATLKRLLSLPIAGFGGGRSADAEDDDPATAASNKSGEAANNNNAEWIDEWVKAYLLQADQLIDSGKHDQASVALDNALQLDASCGRAWEYRGAIAEKKSKYDSAADCYEKAWKCDYEQSPAIGYKISLNSLKAGQPLRAIDTAMKVLKAYPDYPKIRSEVLEKARAMVRP